MREERLWKNITLYKPPTSGFCQEGEATCFPGPLAEKQSMEQEKVWFPGSKNHYSKRTIINPGC